MTFLRHWEEVTRRAVLSHDESQRGGVVEDDKNATSVASLFLKFSHVGLKRKVVSMWLCFASAMLTLKEEAF